MQKKYLKRQNSENVASETISWLPFPCPPSHEQRIGAATASEQEFPVHADCRARAACAGLYWREALLFVDKTKC